MKSYLEYLIHMPLYYRIAISLVCVILTAQLAEAETVPACPGVATNCGITRHHNDGGSNPPPPPPSRGNLGGGGGGSRSPGQYNDVPARGSPKPKAKPTSENNSEIPCEAGVTAHPVIVTTGEKIKSEPDFDGNGLYGIGLTRMYRSKHASGTLFGPNWLSNLDAPKLALSNPTTVRVLRGTFTYYKNITLTNFDGSAYRYTGIPFDTDGSTPGVRYVVGTTTGAASTGVITRENGSNSYELTQDKKILFV